MDTMLHALQITLEQEISKATGALRFEMYCTGQENAQTTRWRPLMEGIQDKFKFADNLCLEWFRAQPGVLAHFEARGWYPHGPAQEELDRRRAALAEQKAQVFARFQLALVR